MAQFGKIAPKYNGLSDPEVAAAKLYAKAHGFVGKEGGWIYAKRESADDAVVTQGWWSFASFYKTRVLNWLCWELTAFHSIDEVCSAKGVYRPTLSVSRDWRWAYLADAYDNEQARRGDPRRAHRI